MTADIIQILGTSVLTGMVASVGTIKSLKVHIEYLKDSVKSAHERIDKHIEQDSKK